MKKDNYVSYIYNYSVMTINKIFSFSITYRFFGGEGQCAICVFLISAAEISVLLGL